VFNLTSSEESPRRQWLVLIIILIAPLMSYVDVYIVFVASPSIQNGLQTSFLRVWSSEQLKGTMTSRTCYSMV